MFFPPARLPVNADKAEENDLVFLFTAFLTQAEYDGRQMLRLAAVELCKNEKKNILLRFRMQHPS